MASGLELIDTIAGGAGRLSVTEERLLTHLSGQPEAWAFGSTSELARGLQVHRSTIVRFAQSLGYRGFSDLQDAVRRFILQPLDLSPEALFDDLGGEESEVVKRVYDHEVRNLAQTYSSLDLDVLRDTAVALANARRVVVFGRRFSYPIALHLSMALSLLREGVGIVPAPGGSTVDAIFDLGKDDYGLVVSLRRHSPEVRRVLGFFRDHRIPHAVLTDVSVLNHHHDGASRRLQAYIGSTSLLESYTGLTSISHALVTLVGRQLPDAGARKNAVETAWQKLA
jgi:DNA-binding MurR/RpiR family transcriptional regulator